MRDLRPESESNWKEGEKESRGETGGVISQEGRGGGGGGVR